MKSHPFPYRRKAWPNYRACEVVRPQYISLRLKKIIDRKIGDIVMVTGFFHSGLYGYLYFGEVGDVVCIENYYSYQKAVVRFANGRTRSFYMGDLECQI